MDDLVTFPVATWDFAIVAAHKVIIFRPHFLAHSMQPDDRPTVSRYYAFSAAQLVELREQIGQALHVLQSGGAGSGPHPRH